MRFAPEWLRYATIIALPAACCLAAACSSGGGSPTPSPTSTPTSTPVPTNAAPVLTSATALTIVENGAMNYRTTATDADGDPITFTIAGGPDAGEFVMTGSGIVNFKENPNYDQPTDVEGDNVYSIILRASDGKTSTTSNLTVTITNDTEGLSLTRIAQFNDPVLARRDLTNNEAVLVGERSGAIYRLFRNGTKTLLLSVGNLDMSNGGGLIGFGRSSGQASPNMYVYVKSADGSLQVRVIDYYGGPGTERTVNTIQIAPPGTTGNYGGWIYFQGYDFYLGTGDGGGTSDPNNNAQNPTSRLGKVLKFSGDLTPASGSPFFPGADPYVYAIGVQDPRTGFDDSFTFADSGATAFEEINSLGAGRNYGWPYLEGDRTIRGIAPAGLTAPLTMYAHGTGLREGGSIASGVLYRGPAGTLAYAYVFGDAVTGHLWSTPSTGMASMPGPSRTYNLRDLDFRPASGSFGKPIAIANNAYWDLFVINQAGEVYLMPGVPR